MYLKNSKIVIIKIGSSLLIDESKKIRKKWLSEFSKDIQYLLTENKSDVAFNADLNFFLWLFSVRAPID